MRTEQNPVLSGSVNEHVLCIESIYSNVTNQLGALLHSKPNIGESHSQQMHADISKVLWVLNNGDVACVCGCRELSICALLLQWCNDLVGERVQKGCGNRHAVV